MNKILATLICTLTSLLAAGQTITVPAFNDRYSEYVRKLESGQTDIDYQDFRFSLIESEQFKIVNEHINKLNDLKKEMYKKMAQSKHEEIIALAKRMLSIDYTSMIAHKVLRQTYKII